MPYPRRLSFSYWMSWEPEISRNSTLLWTHVTQLCCTTPLLVAVTLTSMDRLISASLILPYSSSLLPCYQRWGLSISLMRGNRGLPVSPHLQVERSFSHFLRPTESLLGRSVSHWVCFQEQPLHSTRSTISLCIPIKIYAFSNIQSKYEFSDTFMLFYLLMLPCYYVNIDPYP
jgi:hypothetical protein